MVEELRRVVSKRSIRSLISTGRSGPQRERTDADYSQIKRIIDRGWPDHPEQPAIARGWKEIALLLGMNERNARRAYRDNAHLRRVIFKTPGRGYWGDPGEIGLALTGGTSVKRSTAARAKTRGASGHFKEKTPAAE